jgi:RNA-directed DNA polymerase
VLLYIERWLKAPVELEDGTLLARDRGTPQGGVISPLLANIFLHHVLDEWLKENYPGCPFDFRWFRHGLVIHCPSHERAQQVKAAVEQRLQRCKLQSHPDKTRIVYCRDSNRTQDHAHIQFDFLGYGFRPRKSMARGGKPFTSFGPAISAKASKAIVAEVRRWKLHRRSDLELTDLSRRFNAKIRGWVAYFSRYGRTALRRTLRPLNRRLALWAQKKYKRMRRRPGHSSQWLGRIARSCPTLFAHWAAGFAP